MLALTRRSPRHLVSPGFTLVEGLIALVLIGLIAGFVMTKFGEVKERAYTDAMRNDLRNAALEETKYHHAHGHFGSWTELVQQTEFTFTEGVRPDSFAATSKKVYLRVSHTKTDIRCELEWLPFQIEADPGNLTDRVECPGSPGDQSANGPPMAAYEYSPADPGAGQAVQFDGRLSSDPDGDPIVAFNWTFEEGETGTGVTPTYTFPSQGTYQVELFVTDSHGAVGSTTKTIQVGDGPPQPVIAFSPSSPEVGETVTFDGTASTDPEGQPLTYEWNLGTKIVEDSISSTSYDESGHWQVELTVTDVKGQSVTADTLVPVGVSNAGDLEVITSTAGDSLDSDGYEFQVVGSEGGLYDVSAGRVSADAEGAHPIGLDDARTLPSLPAGRYSVELMGLAPQCGTNHNPTEVDVVSGHRTRVPFDVWCSGPTSGEGSGFLEVRTTTTGRNQDTDGYAVLLDETSGRAIGINDTLVFAGLSAGEHAVELTELADNCGVVGPNPTSVSVPAGDTAVVTKSVRCTDELIEAAFDFVPESPDASNQVRFDASASRSTDGAIVEYRWDFEPSVEPVSTADPITYHSFSEAGDYVVELRVTDEAGRVAYTSRTVPVGAASPWNRPPVADLEVRPDPVRPGEPATLDATDSFDPDGNLQSSKTWALGNGQQVEQSSDSLQYTYPSAGQYTARVIVRDDQGAADTAQALVRVEAENAPPTACFEHEPAAPENQDQVAFDGSCSSDPNGQVVSYDWRFEGQAFRTSQEVGYIFGGVGSREVRLIVADDEGARDTLVEQVDVAPKPPVADFEWTPPQPFTGDSVQFDGSLSHDEEWIVGYRWEVGGQVRTGKAVNLVFQTDSVFDVALVVEDNHGAKDTAVKAVAVGNRPPVGQFEVRPENRHAEQELTFDGSASHDPDGTLVDVAWTYGDNTTGSGLTTTHTYDEAGNYPVELSLTDNDGATTVVVDTLPVDPPNQAPTAAFSAPGSIFTGDTAVFDGSESSDADGEIAMHRWNFGEGPADNSVGEVGRNVYQAPGDYDVRLVVEDEDGARDTVVHPIRVTQALQLVAQWDPCSSFDTGTYRDAYAGHHATLAFSDGRTVSDWSKHWGIQPPVHIDNWDPNDGTDTKELFATVGGGMARTAVDFTVATRLSYGDGNLGHAPILSVVNGAGPSWSLTITEDGELLLAGQELARNLSQVGYLSIVVRAQMGADGQQQATAFINGERRLTRAVGTSSDPLMLNGAVDLMRVSQNAYFAGQMATIVYYDGYATDSEVQFIHDTLLGQDCDVNRPPEADFSFPSRVWQGQPITLDASASSDPADQIVEFEWSLGADGVVSADSARLEHTFTQAAGDVDVQLVTRDSHGATDTVVKTVHVSPRAQLAAHWSPCASFDSGTFVDVVGGHNGQITDWDTPDDWSDNWTGKDPSAPKVWMKGVHVEDVPLSSTSPDWTIVFRMRKRLATGPLLTGPVDLYIENQKTSYTDWQKVQTNLYLNEVDSAPAEWERILNGDPDGSEFMTVAVTVWQQQNGEQYAYAYMNGQRVVDFSQDISGDDTVGDDNRTFDGTFRFYKVSYNEVGAVRFYEGVATDAKMAAIHQDVAGTTCAESQVNREPTADFTHTPEVLMDDEPATFDASASTDFLEDELTYAWTFNDGSTAEGQTVEHTYSEPGNYPVQLVVTDDQGAADTLTREVRVTQGPELISRWNPCPSFEGDTFVDDAGTQTHDATLFGSSDWPSRWQTDGSTPFLSLGKSQSNVHGRIPLPGPDSDAKDFALFFHVSPAYNENAANDVVFSARNANASVPWSVHIDGDRNMASIGGVGGTAAFSSTPIQAKWHTVAFRVRMLESAQRVDLFVDGSKVGSQMIDQMLTVSGDMNLFRNISSGGNYFKGRVSVLEFWEGFPSDPQMADVSATLASWSCS